MIIEEHRFKVNIEILPGEQNCWKDKIRSWLEDNKALISGIKTGIVLDIKDYHYTSPLIIGYENKSIVEVSINARVYIPVIGEIIRVKIIEKQKKFMIGSIDYALVWIDGSDCADEWVDVLKVRITAFRFDKTRFLIVGAPVVN